MKYLRQTYILKKCSFFICNSNVTGQLVFLFPPPKTDLTQPLRLNPQIFKGRSCKWAEKRQIPMSCSLKDNYF